MTITCSSPFRISHIYVKEVNEISLFRQIQFLYEHTGARLLNGGSGLHCQNHKSLIYLETRELNGVLTSGRDIFGWLQTSNHSCWCGSFWNQCHCLLSVAEIIIFVMRKVPFQTIHTKNCSQDIAYIIRVCSLDEQYHT